LVRSTLAIYITLFAVTLVAIAQILYFKLVLSRRRTAPEAASDTGWLYEPVDACIGVGVHSLDAALASEPPPVAEPAFAAEPVLLAA
jgi:hypothetical protein